MENFIDKIRRELEKNIDEKTQSTCQNYFKEKIKCYGVKTAIVGKISKEYFKLMRGKTKSDIFALCDNLWQSEYIEESFIACNWSYYIHKNYEPEDFKIFKKDMVGC